MAVRRVLIDSPHPNFVGSAAGQSQHPVLCAVNLDVQPLNPVVARHGIGGRIIHPDHC